MRSIRRRPSCATSGAVGTRIGCNRERVSLNACILQARKRPGLRKDSGPFFCRPFNPIARPGSRGVQPAIDGSRLAANGPPGCSFKTCREATPKLVGITASQLADVAQLAARDHATVEATGSIPVIRSLSGVPVHKHWAGPVCMCAGAAAPACSGCLDSRRAPRADTAEMEVIALR